MVQQVRLTMSSTEHGGLLHVLPLTVHLIFVWVVVVAYRILVSDPVSLGLIRVLNLIRVWPRGSRPKGSRHGLTKSTDPYTYIVYCFNLYILECTASLKFVWATILECPNGNKLFRSSFKVPMINLLYFRAQTTLKNQ